MTQNYTRARRITGRVAALLALGALVALATPCAGAAGGSAMTDGWTALVNEDYAAAVRHLSIAVENSPTDWKPRLYLGWAYAESGDLVRAREEWAAALGTCRGDREWNEVVDAMRAHGVDASADDAIGESGDRVGVAAKAKARIASESPAKRHMPKFFWWGIAALLVGVSLAGRPE